MVFADVHKRELAAYDLLSALIDQHGLDQVLCLLLYGQYSTHDGRKAGTLPANGRQNGNGHTKVQNDVHS
jgi:hypothetical protein